MLGHSNIKMTERYADLASAHIVKTGNVSRELWSKMEPQSGSETSNHDIIKYLADMAALFRGAALAGSSLDAAGLTGRRQSTELLKFPLAHKEKP